MMFIAFAMLYYGLILFNLRRITKIKGAEMDSKKLNLTEYSLFISIDDANLTHLNSIGMPWSEFVDEANYKLGQDFELHYQVLHRDVKILKQGQNNVVSNYVGDHNITLEKILTVYNGNCYKVISTLSAANSAIATYFLKFNETISFVDIPSISIYFTSEENAFGIIGSTWNYGDELKFRLTQNSKDTGSTSLVGSKKNFLFNF